MTDEKELPTELTFITETSENHVSILSNRVWGGLKFGGLFELNFLLETTPLPDEVTVKINSDGTEEEISRTDSGKIIRENQATVNLTLESLLALHSWLDNKVSELEARGLINKKQTSDIDST